MCLFFYLGFKVGGGYVWEKVESFGENFLY